MKLNKRDSLWTIFIQSIMNIIIITDLFGLGEIGINWLKIVLLVLWNIVCSITVGEKVLFANVSNSEERKNEKKKV